MQISEFLKGTDSDRALPLCMRFSFVICAAKAMFEEEKVS